MTYILLSEQDSSGRFRVIKGDEDDVIHVTQVEACLRAISLLYKAPGDRNRIEKYESASSLLQMSPDAAKDIFDLSDEGYAHVCEKARAILELWPRRL
jgi:hypothetical protein